MKLVDILENAPLSNQHGARKKGMMIINQAKKQGYRSAAEIMGFMKKQYPYASYEMRHVVKELLGLA